MAKGRILVTGPAWIGDMIMAQSLFKLLRQQGSTQIDVLAPAWTHPLLARMPEVDRAINFPARHGKLELKMRWQLGKSLRDQRYDQAIVLPKTWKSALPSLAAKIPLRTGFKQEMRGGLLNDLRPLDKAQLPFMVQRYLTLGLEADEKLPSDWPLPQLDADAEAALSVLQQHQLDTQKPLAALAPGAEYGPAKRWPSEHFGSLMQKLLAQGFEVILLGSDKDRENAADIVTRAHAEPKHNLCGKTRLADAIDLMAQAQVAICNDSGLMHMAAACGTGLVAVYGSSSPAFTPPLAGPEKVTILREKLACSPCFARTCQYGHYNCLQQIRPDQVFDAALNLAH